jgi:hypothetical protein
MQTDYSEQDTERVPMAEKTLAGQQTTNLAGTPTALPVPTIPARQNNGIGLAIIALGVLFLLSRFFNVPGLELEAGMIIFTVASCFLFFSFWKRIFGLFIPGALLTGVSVGVTFVGISSGVSIMWGLALAFLAIRQFGRPLFGVNSDWAIYPVVPLFAVGCLLTVINLGPILGLSVMWLPLLLIAVGFYLGFVRRTA